jgi:thiol:disulfide interchange protein DsbD
MTAAWCITCLVNERVALSDPEVAEAFARLGAVYLKGDWTDRNAAIADYLAGIGRTGVPVYVYYPPGGAPLILPQILTPAIVVEALGPPPGPAARPSPGAPP